MPPGTVVLQAERPENFPDDKPFDRYFVLRDNPELKGTDLKNPEQESDPHDAASRSSPSSSPTRGARPSRTSRSASPSAARPRQVPGQPVESSFQTFAIVLDREVVSRPFIDYRENPDGIDGRTGAQISGGFTLQEAQDLANVLKTGALPITLKPISETQVSATLGKQALHEGLIAGIVGFALVLLFLLLFYRLLGAIAGVALFTYAVLFFGLIKLIPITLTLPGIAGLILTIGVAADSNIVIFERIKEELRAGQIDDVGDRDRLQARHRDDHRRERRHADHRVHPVRAGDRGRQGLRVHARCRDARLAVHGGAVHAGVLGTMGRSKMLRSPAMLGAGERHMTWNFDFMGQEQVLLRDVRDASC